MKIVIEKLLEYVRPAPSANPSAYSQEQPGVFLHPISDIIERHDSLIDKTRAICDVDDVLFEAIYMSVIVRVARYAHMLPASQADHHSEFFGLFRHSLEVGLTALKRTEATVFRGKDHSDIERIRGPIWRYGAWLTAVLHDMGKVVSDMRVFDIDQKNEWYPQNGSLYDWAIDNQIERYTFEWPEHMRGAHERATTSLLLHLLPKEAIDYLYSGNNGERIYDEILRGLEGAKHARFTKLVKEADGLSASKDLEMQTRTVLLGTRKQSLHLHIIRVLKNLYKDPKYNELFYPMGTTLGIVYPAALLKAQKILAKENVSVPSKVDEIASHLLRSRYISCDDDNGTYLMPLKDKQKGIIIDALCWCEPSHIIGYGSEPINDNAEWVADNPAEEEDEKELGPESNIAADEQVIKKVVVETTDIHNNEPSIDQDIAEIVPPIDEQVDIAHEKSKTIHSNQAPLVAKVSTAKPKNKKITSKNKPKTAGQNIDFNFDDAMFAKPVEKKKDVTNNTSLTMPDTLLSESVKETPSQNKPHSAVIKPKRSSDQKQPKPFANPHHDDLLKMGSCGLFLSALSNDLYLNERKELVQLQENGLALRYPDAISNYGTSPKKIHSELKASGCLVSDELMEIDDFQYLLIAPRIAALMLPETMQKTKKSSTITPPLNISVASYTHNLKFDTFEDLIICLLQDAVREKQTGFDVKDGVLTVLKDTCFNFLNKRIKGHKEWNSEFVDDRSDLSFRLYLLKNMTNLSFHFEKNNTNDIVFSFNLDQWV